MQQLFYSFLEKLFEKEQEYFLAHDEKSVKISKVREYLNTRSYPSFNKHIWDAAINHSPEDVSLEELNIALEAYEKLEVFIKDLEKETTEKLSNLKSNQ